MSLIVQKYGGTSVGDVDRIRNVAARVVETQKQGHQVVVGVSAMSGETNRLDALARDFSTEAPVLAAGLAHRVDQLRGLEQAAGDVEALGHETMDLLAPLADRLGMSRWRAALEDASFAVVAPVDHASAAIRRRRTRKCEIKSNHGEKKIIRAY